MTEKELMEKEVIEFNNPKNPSTGFLSNQSNYGFVLDGKRWPTVEHYIQAKKFEGTQLEEKIRNAKTIHQIKSYIKKRYRIIEDPTTGEKIREQVYGQGKDIYKIREDWEEVYPNILEEALRAKFFQNKVLQRKLLETGNAQLVNKKEPLTGEILEDIRQEIREKLVSTLSPKISPSKEIKPDDKNTPLLTGEKEDILNQFITVVVKVSKKIMTSEGQNTLYLGMIEDTIYTLFGSKNKKIILQIFEDSLKISVNHIYNNMPHFRELVSAILFKFEDEFSRIEPRTKIRGPIAVAYIIYSVLGENRHPALGGETGKEDWEYLKNRTQRILDNLDRFKVKFLKKKRDYRKGIPPAIPKPKLTLKEKKFLRKSLSSFSKEELGKLSRRKIRTCLEQQDMGDMTKKEDFKSYLEKISIELLTKESPKTRSSKTPSPRSKSPRKSPKTPSPQKSPKDIFVFSINSPDNPPGKGDKEKLTSKPKKYFDLSQIKNWRRALSNLYEKEFKLDGKRWLSVEHYFQGEKFRKRHPETREDFSLDSGSELSKSSLLAKDYDKKKWVKKGQDTGEDKDFYTKTIRGVKWPDHIKRQAMLAKFTQNSNLKEILLETKTASLYHKKPFQRDFNLEWVRNIVRKKPDDFVFGVPVKEPPTSQEKPKREYLPEDLTIEDEKGGNFIVYGKPLEEHTRRLLALGGKFPRSRKGVPDRTRIRFKFYMKPAIDKYIFSTYSDEIKLRVSVSRWISLKKLSFLDASKHIADLKNTKEIEKDFLGIVINDIYNFKIKESKLQITDEPNFYEDINNIILRAKYPGYSITIEAVNYLYACLSFLEREIRPLGTTYEEYLKHIKNIEERKECPSYKGINKVSSCIVKSLDNITSKLSEKLNLPLDATLCSKAFLILLPPLAWKKGAETYIDMVLKDYKDLGFEETQNKYEFLSNYKDACSSLKSCDSEGCLIIFFAVAFYVNNLIEKPANVEIKNMMRKRIKLFLD